MSVNIPEAAYKRVVIVGAGFAGLKLAIRLKRSDYQVVLLDKNNYHQFQPLFYQVAMAGLEPSSISFPLRKIFQNRKNVHIRVCEVLTVDPSEKKLDTTIGSLPYDYLVLAMGADSNFFGNASIARKSLPMKSVSEALYLRNAILQDYENSLSVSDYEERQKLIDIVIAGGGPTGVEVAGALAEMRKFVLPQDYPELDTSEIDIHLVEGADRLLLGMSDEAAEAALRFLKKLDVNVKLNTFVNDFDGEQVYLSDDTTIRSRKLIWAAGIQGNTIEGLPEDLIVKGRRIKVDSYSRVLDQTHMFALGDVAFMDTEDYPEGHPQVAAVAIQHGKHLAKNLLREQKGKDWIPFSYTDKGSMATIGRKRAVVDLPFWKTQGAFAWILWLAVHLVQILGVKNKLFVFLNWLWNYLFYDQSLRLIIRARETKQ